MMYGYIYLTTNLINNKKYIGQHKASFFDTNYFGSGKILQDALHKYGKENFKCEILQEANSESELNDLEIYYINLYDAIERDDFYNLCEGGTNWNYVNANREKFNVGMIGKKHSEQSKQKMSITKKGHIVSLETRQKLREKSLQYRHTDEEKRKIGDAHRGTHHSEETKQKISNSHKGKKLSEEHKRKIRESCKGINKGAVRSEETRKRLSEIRKQYWENKKNGTTTSN